MLGDDPPHKKKATVTYSRADIKGGHKRLFWASLSRLKPRAAPRQRREAQRHDSNKGASTLIHLSHSIPLLSLAVRPSALSGPDPT